MSKPHYHSLNKTSSIAYRKLPGKSPGIIFLSGHGSDMDGTKALACEAWAAAAGHAFLRFDYQGHGQSTGVFLDGTISSWTADSLAVLDDLTEGPQILVGSSLGGWLMLNVALARPKRIAGLIGIAAAPDFTEDLIWDGLDSVQQAAMQADGKIALPNPYADEPVVYPFHLVTDGRDNLRLRGPLEITAPMRLLQGMQDHEVPWQTATRIAECLTGENVEVTLVKGAGHRFSEPDQIDLLTKTLADLVAKTS